MLSIFLNLEPIINECREYSDLIITFRALTKRNLTSTRLKKKKKSSLTADFDSKLEDFDIDWDEVLEDTENIKIDSKLINRLHSTYDYEKQIFKIDEL